MPATTRRSLADLYAMGTPVKITGPNGAELLWVQKIDGVDHDLCVRKAKAARARARATYKDVDSEEYLEMIDTLDSVSRPRDAQLEQVIAPERQKIVESITAEMQHGEDSEWAKDDYLTGLYDTWNNGLKDVYDDDPDDQEALRVMAEFQRFEDELAAAITPRVEELKAQYASMTEDALRAKAIEALIERRLQEAWIEEFVRCQVWLATRKACKDCGKEIDRAEELRAEGKPLDPSEFHQASHDDYYFVNREAVDRLPDTIRDQLEGVYLQLAVDPIEGKDSPETGASSGLSESAEPQETAASSGPAAVPA